MKDFKVGDRVKYTSGRHGDRSNNPLWGGKYGYIRGTVHEIKSTGLPTGVIWDNRNHNAYSKYDLEHVNIIPDEMFTL